MDSPKNGTPIDHSLLIYLVENNPEQIEIIRPLLRNNGYQVKVFTDIDRFRSSCSVSKAERPTAVIMSMEIAGKEESFISLFSNLSFCKNSGIPVLVFSEYDELPARLAALRAGASRYLTKSVDPEHLINLLDELTVRKLPKPYRILLVDDDLELLEWYSSLLSTKGMVVQTLSDPLKTLEAIKSFAPDVVIVDINMHEVTGQELAVILRERDCQLPIIFLSVNADASQQVLGLDVGGDDFLVKPVLEERLLAAITARAQQARQNKAIRQRLETTLYEREQ